MYNDTPFTQRFHSTVQIKQLNETAINSKKLTHGIFLSCIIIKKRISLKSDSQLMPRIDNRC